MRGLIIILFAISGLFAQQVGITGILSTTEGDIGKPVRVIAKRGTTIAMDSTFLLGETYIADWGTVGVDKFDYLLPQPKLLGLANSVSNDGYIYPIVSGDLDQLSYRVYNIQGRELQGKSNIPAGKYFLQLLNKSNGELLGVQSFVLLNNHLSVEFKSNVSNTRLNKPAEDADSLIIVYEADDMDLVPYREAVVVPASGYSQLDIELVRNRQPLELTFSNVPENPTIDTSYVIMINAISPDYDNHITDVDVFHLSGDSILYEWNGVDSLIISPHTQGDHEFHVLANDEYSHRGRNIDLAVESLTHVVQTLDFFGNLDGPYPGLEVWLRDKLQISDENGVALLEFPTPGSALSITDSIEIYHPANDTTFFDLKMPVNAEVDTQRVQTFTDPKGPSYWAGWTWDNAWHGISWLGGIEDSPGQKIARFGSLENGPADSIFVYCPDYTSPAGLEYRPIVEDLLNQRNQELDERAGPGRQSEVHLYLLDNTLEDSIFADQQGMLLHFEEGQTNHTIVDDEVAGDFVYNVAVDAYVAYNASNNENGMQGIRNLVNHEMLGHGLGDIRHTPYNPDYPENQENISAGAGYTLTEQEKDRIFAKLNFAYPNIRHIQGYETLHLGDE